ncbi:MAG: LysR family transcriptional regulator [Oscillospiraceae bacterium]|jgi:DNA-binding transcriptional LysR family regulator|nr:LysR family transcriptional regulator [Oscillospiraceae bacterium]
MYNITYQQIETFLTVSKHLSLSKAAEAMYISQPSLSMTLRRLENSIGVSLFKRSNKGITLTSAGAYLHTALKSLYDNTERAIQFVRDNMSPYSKTLHIATPINYDTSDEFNSVKKVIRDYETAHPSTVVIESLFELRELRQILELGGSDLAVAPDFLLTGVADVTYKQIAYFEFFIAMSSSHPLAPYASSGCITPEMLNGTLFYVMPAVEETADRLSMTEMCSATGFSPGNLAHPPNYQTLLHAVRSGKGLSICLKYSSDENDVIYYPLKELVNNGGGVVIAWRNNNLEPEAKALVDIFPETRR